MQGLEFAVKKGSLIIIDLENKGSLHISFRYYGKPAISPAFEAWNDIETSINSGKLNLRLYGHNTIREQNGFAMSGNVVLSSCHLYDPVLHDSFMHMVFLKPRSEIIGSTLMNIGFSHFGTVLFKECQLDTTPKRVSLRYSSFYRNQLI